MEAFGSSSLRSEWRPSADLHSRPGRPPDVPGRRHVAAPDEPRCPAPGCERPAGLFTDHVGEGLCLRHDGTAPAPEPTPEPSPKPAKAEATSEPAPADPLARRLTGSRASPHAEPLAVMRRVLASARRAGYPFGEAWAIGAEAALSYMSDRKAREWWEALTATERAWADAYACDGSRLAELRR